GGSILRWQSAPAAWRGSFPHRPASRGGHQRASRSPFDRPLPFPETTREGAMAMGTPFLTEQPVAAREIARHLYLSEEARQLLRDEPKADIYVTMLLQQGLDQDALRFLAYRLPKREAVWWGALCAWKGLRPNPPEADEAALHSAVLWVRDDSEANRRVAEVA